METKEIPTNATNGEKTVALAELILEHSKELNACDRVSIDLEKGYLSKLINEVSKTLKEDDPGFFAILLMIYAGLHFEGFVKGMPEKTIRSICLVFALTIMKLESEEKRK